MRNLITDVAGLKVGHAEDARLGSGATAIVFDEPAVASVDLRGGGPGTRETELLTAASTVERIDAIALSGGSAFGLDATSGVQAWLREQGRGFAIREARVPIVPGAIVFDLLSGGDKNWGRFSPYRELGYDAAASASLDFALGSAGAGLGATVANLKGGLGSASAVTEDGLTIGALVVVNAVGSVTIGDGPHFWAAPFERDKEFGGLGWPKSFGAERACAAHQGRRAAGHHHRAGRNRRQAQQGAGASAGGDGADRHAARDLSGAYPARRRSGLCRRDRQKAPARSAVLAHRARHARRQCAGPRHRARGV